MDHSGKPERLEVNEDATRHRLESQLRVIGSGPGPISGHPSIGPVGRCKILDSVKQFLPEMAKAEKDLNLRLQSGENLDIEHCSVDDHYIEMNVGILEKATANTDWSEDSEPDSPPSPADRDNSFTSDTDPDSSTGSEADSTDNNSASSSSASSLRVGNLKLPGQNPISKRPIIEEIIPAEVPPNKKEK